MAVMFSIPRSHGAAITGYELWRKRCKDKEESTYHDESIAKCVDLCLRVDFVVIFADSLKSCLQPIYEGSNVR